MTIYAIYISAAILLGWYLYGDKITPSQKQNCMLGLGLFLVLMMSMRYHIGFDYISYLSIYENAATQTWSEFFASNNYDYLFFAVLKLFASMGLNYHIFLFFCNIIMVCCVFFVIYDYSPVWWLSCTLYMTMLIVPFSMNMLRQAIAASIVFAGWGLIKKGKFWRFCLVVLIASLIHTSAIIMIPFYFVLRIPFNRLSLSIYGAGTLAAYMLLPFILKIAIEIFPQYSNYSKSSIYTSSNDFTFVIPMLIYAMVAIWFAPMLMRRDKSNSILIQSAFFTFAATLMITKMYVLERFAIYFTFFAMLLLPEIIAAIREESGQQQTAVTPAEPELAAEGADAVPLTGETSMLAQGKEGGEDETAIQPEETPDAAPTPKRRAGISAANIATVAILAFSIIYFGLNAKSGAHKCFPYVGIWEPQNVVSNNNYFQDHTT